MSSGRGVRIGSQVPTLMCLPDGDDGPGREALELAREVGIVLDPWQELIVRGGLREGRDRRWSALEVVVECPRQNGKNVALEVVELGGLLLFGERLIIHSAHLFATAAEHFARMRALFEQPPLADELDAVYTANGKEALVLRGGARLKFVARSRSSGRGFGADRLVFDEAFSLDAASMGSLLPALSARSTEVPGPQVWYASSPAHADSAVLHAARRRAMSDDPRLAYFGWLNEPGTARDDRDAWYRVNPGLGIRISEEWIERELAALSGLDDEFDRERLGIPSSEDAGATVFGAGRWPACVDEVSQIAHGMAIGLDVSPDMAWSSFAACGRRNDGLWHVELIDRRPGTGWVVGRARELAVKWDVPIALDPHSPAVGLQDALESAGVPVVKLPSSTMPRACAQLQEAVMSGTVRHLGQAPLDAAVAAAAIRRNGDTWTWARRTAASDISPLVAVTVAMAAASQTVDMALQVW